MMRIREEFGGVGLFNHLTQVHYAHPVAHVPDRGELVRYQQIAQSI